MGKIARLLRFLAVLSMFVVGANAFAIGFVCENERTYTSCVSGYYLSDCGDYVDGRTLTESDLSAGNSCVLCPDGYDCEGGMKCPYNPNADEDGGFVCDEAYFECESGYYLSDCGDALDGRTLTNDDITVGNSCVACPEGYDCIGGMTCPADEPILQECPEGQYLSDCGASSNWGGQDLLDNELTLGNACLNCPDGWICDGGAFCPYRDDGVSGFVCDTKRFLTCPEGQFLSDCGSSSNWNGQVLTTDDLTAGNACVECPEGVICDGGKTCPTDPDYKFELKTVLGTTSFNVGISAAGKFYIDWGDGNIETIINETIAYEFVSHSYDTAGQYTIKIGGLATGYDVEAITQDDSPVINFSAAKIASIGGSLGAIFPTLSNGDQPGFFSTFAGSKITSLPSTLFNGIRGAGESMFTETFAGCTGLTEIPAGLFSGISGAADWMFNSTFFGCTGLTEIPAGLFSGVSGAAAHMFSGTFDGTQITSIPADLFSGVTGGAASLFSNTFANTSVVSIPAGLFSGIDDVADYMFSGTFDSCTSLKSIPTGLFDGLYGQDSIPDTMFEGTFSACTSLTGPAARFSDELGGKYLHQVWPMLDADMWTYADTNIDNLKYIPTSWGGDGYIKCDVGEYLPAGESVCAVCPVGSYCVGITDVNTSASDQGIESCPSGYTNNETGLTSGVDCFGGYKFTIETLPMTGEFGFSMMAVNGNFWVDWGDGTPVEYIPITDFSNKPVSHTYEGSAVARTIKMGGLATEYHPTVLPWTARIIVFTNNTNISKLYGSLGAIFPTLANGAQPGFVTAFAGNSNLTQIPSTLFDGITGQPRGYMFTQTFAGTGLTSIPEGLFAGLDGAPTEMLFANTFGGTKITSIPAGLFSGIKGAPALNMFNATFADTKITSIPEGLFDGLNTSAAAADGMFAQTFYNCTSLTGPAAKMSAANGGQYLHKIWPMTGATMQTYTGTNIDGLRVIPVSWGGEGVLGCDPGQYLKSNATTCSACEAGYYCPGGELTPSTTANVGRNSCSTDTGSKYTSSAASSYSIEQCYVTVVAGKYVAEATKGQVDCAEGNYCAGGTTVYYGAAGGTTTGGMTECPAGSYCPAKASAATKCPGLYVNSPAGSNAAEDCYFTPAVGYYIASSGATAETECEAGYYCPNNKLNYPNVSAKTACPAPADHKRTSVPSTYYNAQIESTQSSGTKKTKIEQCTAFTWLVSGSVGKLYEYATYNTTTQKYDNTTSYAWSEVKPGYYLKTPASCGTYAYYLEAVPCEKNSYCPGKAAVTCNSSNQATVHTATFGLESCGTATGDAYGLSDGGTSAKTVNACYLMTPKYQFVKEPNAAPTLCEAGSACAGGVKVVYGQTGGATACSGATYSGAGAASCTTCPTAAQYADKVVSYNNVGHTDKANCYATFDVDVNNGSVDSVNCYLKTGSDYGNATNGVNHCWTHTTNLTCGAGYYLSTDLHAYNTERWFQNLNQAMTGTCIEVGAGHWSPADSLTRNDCAAGYDDGSATASVETDCKMTVPAGKVVESAGAAATTPTGHWYSAQHTVSQGSTSGSNKQSCATSYTTTNSTTQTDHDAETDCKITCEAGSYVKTARQACVSVDVSGKFMGKHTVEQSKNSTLESCPDGWDGSDGNRDSNKSCYAACATSDKTISNGTITSVVNAKEYYTGSAYPACKYNASCSATYGLSGN
ncbi:MAG: hypothetical protein J6R22_04595, partial [Alphaproteobacteria bacterium]|nr:hypothetical protein [Alphaproteobacteria bacterium]